MTPHSSLRSTTLVLASASPRRSELLQQAGVKFEKLPSHCCEDWNEDSHVEQYVQRIAHLKAQSGWQSWQSSTSNFHHKEPVVVIAADTTVWRNSTKPIGKPVDREEAYQMIRTLADGGSHTVTTGYCILSFSRVAPAETSQNRKEKVSFVDESPEQKWEYRPDKKLLSFESTKVWMNKLDDAAIERYLDQNEWSDKAGAYGIQGIAGCFVSRIEGSYTNVVGLPVTQVLQGLAKIGYILPI